MVRSSDTDVLIILLDLVGRSDDLSIIMDYGQANYRRYINVSNLAACLEEKQSGITGALIGLHSLIGCDFTSSFSRKGKARPFELLESDVSGRYIMALQSLTSEEVDMAAVTSYVCWLYGFKTNDVNEARYMAFLCMSGGNQKVSLSKIKEKINCGALPPCSKTLQNHIKRSHFVAMMWKNADKPDPLQGRSPLNYGWKMSEDGLEAEWFPGHPIPESITDPLENHVGMAESVPEEYEESDNA